MSRVLVTGASGFVGTALCEVLQQRGYLVRAAFRTMRNFSGGGEAAIVGEIGPATEWSAALENVDFVLHLAARAHHMADSSRHAAIYHQINAAGTLHLARAAAAAGVRRFVYLSSVKVNGEATTRDPFTESDAPHPEDDYARSKWLGETYVGEIARNSNLEAVIVRSPLVYGPGVRANFFQLMRWVERDWPLPFGGIRNLRSFVSIWNLTDLLVHTLEHRGAAGRTWMVSDGHDLSTPDLVLQIGLAMRRRVRLLRVPTWLLRGAAIAVGRGAQASRLSDSLVVDISATCRLLEWEPPVDVRQSLERTAKWYMEGASA